MSWASLVAQLVNNCMQCRIPWLDSWVGKFPWRSYRLSTPVFLGFPGGSEDKESACNAGDLDLIPGLGKFPGGRHGNPLQYSCLENPHVQRSLVCCNPWVAKSQTVLKWLSMHACSIGIITDILSRSLCLHWAPDKRENVSMCFSIYVHVFSST